MSSRKHVATGTPRGEHPNSRANLEIPRRPKLTEEQIKRMRARYEDGEETLAEVGRAFGVGGRAAWKYLHRKKT